MVAIAAVLSIAACSKQVEDRTVGQQVDSAVAKVEQKTDQAVAAVKSGVDSAETSGGKMVDATKEKVKDATITTSINAELARDTSLSALKINVDTSAGRVALKGTAPDAAARDRATVLAQRVDGVTGVDNQLVIRSN
jgi:osmotically-inducible protein OsmY